MATAELARTMFASISQHARLFAAFNTASFFCLYLLRLLSLELSFKAGGF